ncbi:MAG: ABC transporter permease [Chloroflexota bacterium]|nr:ABC transporter permease [Chloroflexota bacterium]
MLNQWISNQIWLGAAQAGVVMLTALLVLFFTTRLKLGLEKDILIGLGRGIVQIVAVGFLLTLIFSGPLWLAVPVILVMIGVASLTTVRRIRDIPNALWISLVGILLGAGSTIAVMTFLGVLKQDLTSIIPIGSMMVYGSMNTNALMLERFRSELASHAGQVEAGLALGASPEEVVQPYARRAVSAALMPRINGLQSLGIVWIPGAMAGMVLTGENPAYAGFYQFVVSGSIFITAGITVLITILLVRKQVFSPADQLIIRGEEKG